MQAIRLHQHGGPDVLKLEIIVRPTLGDRDVLVRVIASGVNPIEWKIRRGDMARALGRPLPVTMGSQFAGVVDQVGADVSRFSAGDAVFAFSEFGRDGSHAEFIAIDKPQLAAKPASLSFNDAAAVPMTTPAAWSVLAAADLKACERALIHGAGGSVGHWLVQLAKPTGARIVATCAAADIARVRTLGAGKALDYRSQRFEDFGPFDVVAPPPLAWAAR